MFGSKTTTPLQFTNTLTGAKEEFIPLTPGKATLYSCGPTVYGPVQIGNLRSFVLADTVARTLAAAGYEVKRVMNITDVGHLVADAEQGEDKMAVGAKRDNVSPKEIATRYSKLFLHDIHALNVGTKFIRFPRATDYIKEQIAMIKKLEKGGHTYQLSDGIYFDTSTFPQYGKLGNRDTAELQAGARVEMTAGKRHPQDFVLWRTAKPGDLQKWKSPWGVGNPGWSIECSAMATTLLGPTIDLHTGGEDLASIHHNNEIAQSECATGTHPFVRYWLHGAFLTAGGEKLSKSAGNSFTLADVVAKGIHPLALRYLFLQAHYRSPLSFTWEALSASEEALKRLWKIARETKAQVRTSSTSFALTAASADDLATPKVIALLWEKLNFPASADEKWAALVEADMLLGLSLTTPPAEPKTLTLADLPKELQHIAKERQDARDRKDFARSDELRIHLRDSGYHVEDSPSGQVFTPR